MEELFEIVTCDSGFMNHLGEYTEEWYEVTNKKTGEVVCKTDWYEEAKHHKNWNEKFNREEIAYAS